MLINMQGVDGTAAEARVGGGRVFIKEGVTYRAADLQFETPSFKIEFRAF